MKNLVKILTVAAAMAGTAEAGEGSGKRPAAGSPVVSSEPEVSLWSGEGVNLGGVLFPSFHAMGSYAATTGDFGDLSVGHHDPEVDGWNFRNFEAGLSLRLPKYFEAFAIYNVVIDPESDDLDGEFEEFFGKIKDIPGGFEVRGGRFFNRFGFQNHMHPHGYDWANQNLINGRFLGDDGLWSTSGEVTWTLPTPWTSLLSVAVGEVVAVDEHEHGDEEHGHVDFEPEGASMAGDGGLTTVNWVNKYDLNDFHQFTAVAAFGYGKNGYGSHTRIFDLGVQYEWRENGYEPGGAWWRNRAEGMMRFFEARAEHGHEEPEGHEGHGAEEHHDEAAPRDLDEAGLAVSSIYGMGNGLEFGVRYEWLQGVGALGLESRHRVSPVVTYRFGPSRCFFARVQYDFDHGSDGGSGHSVIGQFGWNWGGAEVR